MNGGDRGTGSFAESQAAGLAELASFGTFTSPATPTVPAPAAMPRPAMPRPDPPAPAPPAPAPPAPETPRQPRRLALLRWPVLATILGVQAALTLRLAGGTTAFPDEALYQTAGHVVIGHWLHGTPLPGYAAYFPGAPVLYPPLAALAGHLGGLAGARLLSLAFALTATVLLASTTATLFGRRAAACAAAVFAVAGPTQVTGALATPDALALFLVATAAWCVVSSSRGDESSPRLLIGTLALVLANATAYPTMLLDPAVIALAGLAVAGPRGTKAALGRAGYIAAGTAGALSALLAIGGAGYLAGVRAAVIAPAGGASPAATVLLAAARWAGLACGLALIGVLVSAAETGLARRRGRIRALTLILLAVAGALAPLNQARLHTMISLSRHSALGLWFAAAGAGYAISWLAAAGQRPWLRHPALARPSPRRLLGLAVTGLAVAAVAAPAAILASGQAAGLFRAAPDSTALVASLRSLTRADHGRYLAEDASIPAYYLARQVPWQRWRSTAYFRYVPPGTATTLTGRAAYGAAIRRHYFALIVLSGADTRQADAAIVADMTAAGGYAPVARIGRYTVWAYAPPGPLQLDQAARGLPIPHQPVPPPAPPRPPSGPVEASYGHG